MKLVVEVEPELPLARIDDRAIQLAVINLIDNALKYAPNGDVITVRATADEADGAGRSSCASIDRGPGVPAEERERIFERFVRGARAGREPSARGPRERHRSRAGEAHRREPRGARLGGALRDRPGASFVFTIPARGGRARATSSGELFTREIEGEGANGPRA